MSKGFDNLIHIHEKLITTKIFDSKLKQVFYRSLYSKSGLGQGFCDPIMPPMIIATYTVGS